MMLHDLIDYLGLELPVFVEYRTKRAKSWDAYYIPRFKKGKLSGHIIKINTIDTGRDLDTVLAHELIHAWQEENSKKDIHGKSFIRMAEKVSKTFNLPEIYLKGVDEK